MDKSHLCASEHLHENQIHCAFGNAYCWWCLSELCFSKCQILPRLWVVTLAAFVWHIFVTLTPLISSISPTKGEEDALSKERKVSPNRPGLAQMVTFTKSQNLYHPASKYSHFPEILLTRSYTSPTTQVPTILHFTLLCIVCLIFYSSEDEGSVTGQICVFVNFPDSARVAQKYMLRFGYNLYSFVKETVGEDKIFVFIYFWEIRS